MQKQQQQKLNTFSTNNPSMPSSSQYNNIPNHTTGTSMPVNIDKYEQEFKLEDETSRGRSSRGRGRGKKKPGRKSKNYQNKITSERIATLNKLATPIQPPRKEQKPTLPELPQLNNNYLTNTHNVELQNYVQKEIIHDYSEKVRDYQIREIIEEKRYESEVKEKEKLQRMVTSPIGRKYFNLIVEPPNKGNRKTKICNL